MNIHEQTFYEKKSMNNILCYFKNSIKDQKTLN